MIAERKEVFEQEKSAAMIMTSFNFSGFAIAHIGY
jgi:hypothetical protein